MANLKAILILSFLGLATSKMVTRSWCSQNSAVFNKEARGQISSYYGSFLGSVKEAGKDATSKARGYGGKGHKANLESQLATFSADFKKKFGFVTKATGGLSAEETEQYCYDVYDLAYWLSTTCKQTSAIENPCTEFFTRIYNFFDNGKGKQSTKDKLQHANGPTHAKGQHHNRPVNQENQKSAGGKNKYKNKQSKNKAVPLPQEKTAEVIFPKIVITEIDESTPKEVAQNPQIIVGVENVDDDFEQNDNDSTTVPNQITKREKEVGEAQITNAQVADTIEKINADLEPVAEPEVQKKVKKTKRIIVVEVLSCSDCNKDEAFKKQFPNFE